MNKSLNHELIESVIAEKYINARNFEWNEGSLDFIYDCERDEKYVIENDTLHKMIDNMSVEQTMLSVKYDEAQSMISRILKEAFRG